jgi:ribosome-associated protein
VSLVDRRRHGVLFMIGVNRGWGRLPRWILGSVISPCRPRMTDLLAGTKSGIAGPLWLPGAILDSGPNTSLPGGRRVGHIFKGNSVGVVRTPDERQAQYDEPMTGSLAKALRITDDIAIEQRELTWRFSRASGPGGQGVNTTDSRVELSWNLEESAALSERLKDRVRMRLQGRLRKGAITVVASEQRSQRQNRQAALDRFSRLLASAVAAPPKRRRPNRPSRSAVERRLAAKRRRGQVKGNRRRPAIDD